MKLVVKSDWCFRQAGLRHAYAASSYVLGSKYLYRQSCHRDRPYRKVYFKFYPPEELVRHGHLQSTAPPCRIEDFREA
ncbi:MAG TPA: hypothetical protein VEL51_10300, partial [Vicinamibacterales bacterium]|nr:hypothetical protein [Vicinamibacterales bacterium]